MKAQNAIRSLIIAIFLAAFSVAVQAGEKMRVVYHVADADKVNFALGNMRNHIKGVGGPENVELVLVVHGPGLKRFHDIQATDKLRKMVSGLQDLGVEFDACGNTMRAQQVQTDDLIPGMIRVDQGGVVRIAELQQQGYLYIRP